MGRINRGDGDGGDPARSPSGHASFRWPNRSNWRAGQEIAKAGTPAFLGEPVLCHLVDFSVVVQDMVLSRAKLKSAPASR